MKKHVTFVLLTILSCLLMSCKFSRDAIEDLKDLTERVEQEGSEYSSTDWEKVYNEYEEIIAYMDQQQYTNEELREIGRLKIQFISACVANGYNSLGEILNRLFQQSVGAGDELINKLQDKLKQVDLGTVGSAIE